MSAEQPMQFTVEKSFEFAGKEWRVGEILTVVRTGDKLQIMTMDKDVVANEDAFASIRNYLRNVTPPRD